MTHLSRSARIAFTPALQAKRAALVEADWYGAPCAPLPRVLSACAFPKSMLDKDDKSPHCSCGSGDGSDEHGSKCELVTEGLLA